MNRYRTKCPRVRLDPKSYRQLCKYVLERDGWRCQQCGRLAELQVHHIKLRSHLGNDAEYNLITLCARCHQDVHLGKKIISLIN